MSSKQRRRRCLRNVIHRNYEELQLQLGSTWVDPKLPNTVRVATRMAQWAVPIDIDASASTGAWIRDMCTAAYQRYGAEWFRHAFIVMTLQQYSQMEQPPGIADTDALQDTSRWLFYDKTGALVRLYRRNLQQLWQCLDTQQQQQWNRDAAMDDNWKQTTTPGLYGPVMPWILYTPMELHSPTSPSYEPPDQQIASQSWYSPTSPSYEPPDQQIASQSWHSSSSSRDQTSLDTCDDAKTVDDPLQQFKTSIQAQAQEYFRMTKAIDQLLRRCPQSRSLQMDVVRDVLHRMGQNNLALGQDMNVLVYRLCRLDDTR